MHRIKRFYEKHKITIMVIPNAEKSIKQWKFNLAAAFSILIILIIVNISLLYNTVSSNIKSNSLESQNTNLISDLTQEKDKIASLENINENKTEEITKLKLTMEESINYLDTRLTELESVENQVNEILAMFNSETASNINLPTSRSYVRDDNNRWGNLTASEDDLLNEMEYLVSSEEISAIIASKEECYTSLIDDLENQLIYLDCRPDFVPAEGVLSSTFGYRIDPVYNRRAMHNGIDFANEIGTPIHAAGTGIVTFADYNSSFGNVVIIDHGYGYKTVYAHNSELLVTEGQKVQKGDLISKMGSTGKSTGSHLHFEIRYNDTPINPLKIVNLDN